MKDWERVNLPDARAHELDHELRRIKVRINAALKAIARGEPKNIRHAQTRLGAELKHLDRMRERIGLPAR